MLGFDVGGQGLTIGASNFNDNSWTSVGQIKLQGLMIIDFGFEHT
jgi:hypothetical protein